MPIITPWYPSLLQIHSAASYYCRIGAAHWVLG